MIKPLEIIESMRSNRRPNYIAPGLESYLIGQENCKVRMFHMTHHQQFYISPHNHRFDFCCYVLDGKVTNHHYIPTTGGDPYLISTYDPNTYAKEGLIDIQTVPFIIRNTEYSANSNPWYSMSRDQFHSITFEKGAKVLFFEGASQDKTSNCLQPIVNGKLIPLFSVEEWMYHD